MSASPPPQRPAASSVAQRSPRVGHPGGGACRTRRTNFAEGGWWWNEPTPRTWPGKHNLTASRAVGCCVGNPTRRARKSPAGAGLSQPCGPPKKEEETLAHTETLPQKRLHSTRGTRTAGNKPSSSPAVYPCAYGSRFGRGAATVTARRIASADRRPVLPPTPKHHAQAAPPPAPVTQRRCRARQSASATQVAAARTGPVVAHAPPPITAPWEPRIISPQATAARPHWTNVWRTATSPAPAQSLLTNQSVPRSPPPPPPPRSADRGRVSKLPR